MVVEKRVVEVNAVADELARAGTGAEAMSDPRGHLGGDMSNLQRPLQRARKNSSGGYQRRPSFTDRRISISISPTNALSKAIGLALHRLLEETMFPLRIKLHWPLPYQRKEVMVKIRITEQILVHSQL